MDSICWWLAENTLVAAVLLPLIGVIGWRLRARPADQHLLWLLLLVKLIMPPVVNWPWSGGELCRRLVGLGSSTEAQETDSSSGAIEKATAVLSADVESEEWRVESQTNLLYPLGSGAGGSPFAPDSRTSTPEVAAPRAGKDLAEAVPQYLALVWLVGVIGASVRIGCRLRQQQRAVRNSTDPRRALRDSVDTLARAHGLRKVEVRVASSISSPFLSCLGRPMLVWPRRLADAANVRRHEGVIAHELAHLARRDHWVVWLELVALPMWWWNPLFWLVRRRLSETRELACDALALARTGTDRRGYAERLLDLSSFETSSLRSPVPLLRTGVVSRYSFRRRLTMVFNDRIQGGVTSTGLALVVLLALVALPGWAWSQEGKPLPATDPAAEETEAPAATAADPAETPADGPATVEAARAANDADPNAAAPAPDAEPGSPDRRLVSEFSFQNGRDKVRIWVTGGGTVLVEVEENGRTTVLEAPGLRPSEQVTSPRRVIRATADGSGRVIQEEVDESGRIIREEIGIIREGDGSDRIIRREVAVLVQPPATEPRSADTVSPAPNEVTTTRVARIASAESTVGLLRFDVELAEVNLLEKQLELEAAREELGSGELDSKAARTLKLLEIAVRRAEIELARSKARIETAR